MLACNSGDSGPPTWRRPNPGDSIEYKVTLEIEDSSGGWSKLKLDVTELAASARVVSVDDDLAWVELSVATLQGEGLPWAAVAKPLLLPMQLEAWDAPPVEVKTTQTLAGRELGVAIDRVDKRLENGMLTEVWIAPLAESLYLIDGVVRTLEETPRRDGVVRRRTVELIDLVWGGGATLNDAWPRFFEPGSWSLWKRKEQERELRVTRHHQAVGGGLSTRRETRATVDHTGDGCLEMDEITWCMTEEPKTTSMRLHQLLEGLVDLALAGEWAPEGVGDSVPSKQGYLPVKVSIEEGVMSVEGRPLEFTAQTAYALDPLDLDGLAWPERFAPLRQTRSFPHPWQEKGSDEMLLDWGQH